MLTRRTNGQALDLICVTMHAPAQIHDADAVVGSIVKVGFEDGAK